MTTLRWLSAGPAAALALAAAAGWARSGMAKSRARSQAGGSALRRPGAPPTQDRPPMHQIHMPPLLNAPIQASTLVTSMAFALPLAAIGDVAVRVASTLIVTLVVNLILALLNRARVRFSVPPAAGAPLAPGERVSLTPHQGVPQAPAVKAAAAAPPPTSGDGI